MTQPFPLIAPYAQGLLNVGDGNEMYSETAGNPEGKPALCVHGGPGSGGRRGRSTRFDPEVYRIVQFDQRGCGESRPHASDPAVSLEHNTTEHLIADIGARCRTGWQSRGGVQPAAQQPGRGGPGQG